MNASSLDLETLASTIAFALISTLFVVAQIRRAVKIGQALFANDGIDALLTPRAANYFVIHACLLLALLFVFHSGAEIIFYGQPLRTLAGAGAALGGLVALSLKMSASTANSRSTAHS